MGTQSTWGYSLPLAHLLLRRHLLIILKMRFMVLCLVVLAVSQIDAAPQGFLGGLFGFPNVGSGNGAGFGTGSAGPGGVSSTGVAVASAQNGGATFSTGTGTASSNPFFGFNANGQGSSNS